MGSFEYCFDRLVTQSHIYYNYNFNGKIINFPRTYSDALSVHLESRVSLAQASLIRRKYVSSNLSDFDLSCLGTKKTKEKKAKEN